MIENEGMQRSVFSDDLEALRYKLGFVPVLRFPQWSVTVALAFAANAVRIEIPDSIEFIAWSSTGNLSFLGRDAMINTTTPVGTVREIDAWASNTGTMIGPIYIGGTRSLIVSTASTSGTVRWVNIMGWSKL